MLGFPEGDESEPKCLSRIYKICWGFLREMKVSQSVYAGYIKYAGVS